MQRTTTTLILLLRRCPMYKYEFVANENFKQDLADIASILKMNKSQAIRHILKTMYPYLERKQFFSKRERSNYPNVDAAKRPVKAWLPDRLYNRIKQLHDQLNKFSMAVIVRGVLRWFMDGVKKYGLDGLLKILKEMENRLEFLKQNKRSIYKRRGYIPLGTVTNWYYWIFFDVDFCPTEIKLL